MNTTLAKGSMNRTLVQSQSQTKLNFSKSWKVFVDKTMSGLKNKLRGTKFCNKWRKSTNR